MASQDVIVTRPSELHIAPTFQANVHEVPVNLYRLKVNAQSYDARRMSFTWRAPGNRLICSPQAYLEFELVCHVPYIMTEAECMGAIHGLVDRGGQFLDQDEQKSEHLIPDAGDSRASVSRSYGSSNKKDYAANLQANGQAASGKNLLVGGVGAGHFKPTGMKGIPGGAGYRGGLAFGEGDAVGNAIESIQYTINGCSISHQNWHLFKRSLDRCYMPLALCSGAFIPVEALGTLMM